MRAECWGAGELESEISDRRGAKLSEESNVDLDNTEKAGISSRKKERQLELGIWKKRKRKRTP